MADQNAEIREALALLDPQDDSHWTADGLPVVQVVSRLVQRDLKRSDITNADPTFSRTSSWVEAPEAPKEPEQLSAPPASSLPDHTLPEGFEELEGKLKAAQEQVDEANAKVTAATKRRDELQAELDRLIEIKERNVPRFANQLAIMAYLDGQDKVRQERAARTKALFDAGITPSMFRGKAPIDDVMRRKTGFGQNRPNLPLQR